MTPLTHAYSIHACFPHLPCAQADVDRRLQELWRRLLDDAARRDETKAGGEERIGGSGARGRLPVR